MRICHVLPVLVLGLGSMAVGCGDGVTAGDDTAGDDVVEPPLEGFQIVTPDITIAPGVERTDCYYTTVDVETAKGVKRWASEMTPGSHHMIVYFTETALQPDGTVDDCGGGGGGGANVPVWTYSAQNPVWQSAMPDGVGMTVEAGQPLYIQMHYFNATPAPIDAHVTLNAETYADGEAYIRAAAYVTYNTEIDLAPGETATFGGTCAVPEGVQFFAMGTHAHKRATLTEVRDGSSVVFRSDDWEHPVEAASIKAEWQDDHYTFGTSLSYECTFTNNTQNRVTEGDSAATDEMCMAVGYFFPATGPVFCLNDFVVNL